MTPYEPRRAGESFADAAERLAACEFVSSEAAAMYGVRGQTYALLALAESVDAAAATIAEGIDRIARSLDAVVAGDGLGGGVVRVSVPR